MPEVTIRTSVVVLALTIGFGAVPPTRPSGFDPGLERRTEPPRVPSYKDIREAAEAGNDG